MGEKALLLGPTDDSFIVRTCNVPLLPVLIQRLDVTGER